MTIRSRTGYSFRKAAGKLPVVMDRIIGLGLKAAPITDRASAFGWRSWQELSDEKGLKPVFGVEVAVSAGLRSKSGTDYWTFIAKDSLEPLNRLISLSTSQFYHEPRITYEQAQEIENVLIVLGSRTEFDEVTARDDMAVALSPSAASGYLRRAGLNGFQLIASSDNRFARPQDEPLYEIIAGRDASTQTYSQWLLTDEEWFAAVQDVGDEEKHAALALRDQWFDRSNARMIKGTMIKPDYPDTLRNLCIAGAEKLGVNLLDPVYEERLNRELALISEKNFEDYFYVIADLVAFAKKKMIVGPARGSSCGSLVCYLLGITMIDPIPYDLIFERFIDINRPDLPDIDIDFSEQSRPEAFAYMRKKYGADRVARLGTVTMYKPTSALKEAAAALNIPPWEVDPVVNSFTDGKNIVRNTLDHTQAGGYLVNKYPGIRIAEEMENHPRHYSQHAAGIIVTNENVSKFVAVDLKSNKSQSEYDTDSILGGSTHCDKRDAEALDLLKIDALGLKQLSIFEDALLLAKLPPDHLEKIDLKSSEAIDILNRRLYTGIFQFDGQAVRNTANEIRIDDIEDMIAITSLARPGPLNSGGTQRWIDRKNGHAPVKYPHPLFEPILKNTLGVVTYQEQVMRIGREVAGMDWSDVTLLRKAISKSMGKEHMKTFEDKFIPGAIAAGVDPEVAEKVWDELCENGAYLFNRSHAVAYSVISFQCCWLKAFYPIEFAAATLTHTDNEDTRVRVLRELDEQEGIEFVPYDRQFSERRRWSVMVRDGKKVLVGPLTNIKGVGDGLSEKIYGAIHHGKEMPKRGETLLNEGVSKLSSLHPIQDRIKSFDVRKNFNIVSDPTPVAKIQTNGQQQHDVMTLCLVTSIKQIDENDPDKVSKRGYEFKGPTAAVNLWITDDSGDKLFAKVNRYLFDQIGTKIIKHGRPGKSLWAFKGEVPKNFRMLDIKLARYLGDIDPAWSDKEGRKLKKDEIEEVNHAEEKT